MFDFTHKNKPGFTHKNKPGFVQFILIIAVVCLALGAITPAASAIHYDDLVYTLPDSSVDLSRYVYSLNPSTQYAIHQIGYISSDLPSVDISCRNGYYREGSYYVSTLGSLASADPSIAVLSDYSSGYYGFSDYFYASVFDIETSNWLSSIIYLARFLEEVTDLDPGMTVYFNGELRIWGVPGKVINVDASAYAPVDSLDLSLTAFAPDNPSGMYVLSLDGSLLDTTYTVGINRYTSEFEYLIDSYAYTDGSGSYTFTGSRNITLPIFYNSFTNMPYSYEVSVNVNDENGYLDTRYPVYWSDLGGLYDSAPAPVLPTPIPTPTQTFVPTVPLPSDIIPDPESLNDTVNITGWYQDSGFEGNNITAPIYSGIRGWFNENLVPVIDFFLVPTNYVAAVISDSAETSTDGISYITEELGSYAAPFNTVGSYVVRLVPEVVWIVVFAALSIGYVILLIRVSTGSIKDTIGRFLGGK